jgi:hypothetical protein
MQSGKRYCPECTEHPRAGDEAPDPWRHPYRTRKERAASKELRDAQKAREKKGPGVEVVNMRVEKYEEPKPYKPTPEEEEARYKAVTELEALWEQQAKEKAMRKREAEYRREGGEAGEREVLEGIERGLDPEAAMARHDEIAGFLDGDAETPEDRAFADAFWQRGRYAGEAVRAELERGEDMYTERREPADVEIGA